MMLEKLDALRTWIRTATKTLTTKGTSTKVNDWTDTAEPCTAPTVSF